MERADLKPFNEKGPGECPKCGAKNWIGPLYTRASTTHGGALAAWIANPPHSEYEHLRWSCAKCQFMEHMQCKDSSSEVEATITQLKKKFDVLSNS